MITFTVRFFFFTFLYGIKFCCFVAVIEVVNFITVELYLRYNTNFRHKIAQPAHSWGVQKQTRLNCVDNSALGRQVVHLQ